VTLSLSPALLREKILAQIRFFVDADSPFNTTAAELEIISRINNCEPGYLCRQLLAEGTCGTGTQQRWFG
jgi:hypothetical protein